MVIASGQTRGRGRSGAEWITAPRALAVSLALKVEHKERRPISLMAGVAVSRSLDEVKLKWPNDVLIMGRKVAGILTEMSSRGGVVEYLILGVGVNVKSPEGYTPLTTAIREDRADMVDLLLARGADPGIRGQDWPLCMAV